MYVPVDRPTAVRAAVALAASRPGRLVELSLVYLPDAARAGEEGKRHRPTNPQQLGRPDDRHANCSTGCAVIARTTAAEARGGKTAIGPALDVDQCRVLWQPGQ